MIRFDKYDARGAYHWAETSAWSLKYNAPLVSRYNSLLKRVPTDAASCLDFGCGDGFLSSLLARRLEKGSVVGVDLEPTAIAMAERQRDKAHLGNLSYRRMESDVLPFADQSFDVVVMADVIEHLPDSMTVLAELRRILKEHGTIVVTTPNRQPGQAWDVRHVKEYTAPELAAELALFFGEVRVYGSWPMRFVRMWTRRRFGRLKLDLLSRLGRNSFDAEVEHPGRDYGQLTAVARRTGGRG